MEILLILIYVSIRIVIFKIFRIPVNECSLATAALGGIVGIAFLLLSQTVKCHCRIQIGEEPERPFACAAG